MSATVHVIGAGMAGLAASVRLAQTGRKVALYDAAGQAGGRCRSYFDETLGCRLDNGNHLLVSGNTAAMAYIAETNAAATFVTADIAAFPFLDLKSQERWSVRPTEGRVPWWLFVAGRRVAGTSALDYLDALKLTRAAATATISQTLDARRVIYERLWVPLAVAALNTEVEQASARLLGMIFAETFGRGGAGLHPLYPKEGLSESLVDPALAVIQAKGGSLRFGQRLRSLRFEGERVAALDFGRGELALDAEDSVVLAITAPVAKDLIPALDPPDAFRAIVNSHFKVETLPGQAYSFLGLVNGTADWIFLKPGVISTTTSAADRLVDRDAEVLAAALWKDIAQAYGLDPAKLPAHRVVKEKRATFACTPAQLLRRPKARTRWRNLVLAGDWTDTGWPATIEGAIRSGFTAAAALAA
ncbi:hydroxysqualene dehydroxylase HpnE [Dongia sp.]|uniref:hydroxysqualene dehydroxylase HpnE n=1 Tax=Dongia sp. TaxID=1977262 RepID=UPI003750D896